MSPSENSTFSAADVRATYRFLHHTPYGVTELRAIAPNRGPVLGIGYFDDEDAFVAACEAVNGTGNVYVGIQPRPRRFLEQAPNVIRSLSNGARDQDIECITATVLDIDPVRPKNTAATDEELAVAIACANELVAGIVGEGFHQPVRNMSGNGCQVWFALPPHQLSTRNRDDATRRLKAFEAAQRCTFATESAKFDSIYNLSRIIKVIGTLSVKGDHSAQRPHRLSRSLDPFERKEDPALLELILNLPARQERAREKSSSGTHDCKIGAQLSKPVHALILTNRQIGALFAGRGKTAIGADGKPMDTSSSGYDFSLLLALIGKGITDRDELATALWHRPDEAARAKGLGYITRTVESALERIEVVASDLDGKECIDFTVERITIRESDPPYYHLQVDGKVLILTADQLLSPPLFRRRFMEILRRIPKLPGKKCPPWPTFVNELLGRAEIQKQPADASERGMLSAEITSIIDDAGEADAVEDLDRVKVILVAGRRAFKASPLRRALHDRGHGDPKMHELCDVLRDLKCDYDRHTFLGKRVRVWIAPPTWPDDDPETGDEDSAPGVREPGSDDGEDDP